MCYLSCSFVIFAAPFAALLFAMYLAGPGANFLRVLFVFPFFIGELLLIIFFANFLFQNY